MHVPRFFAPCLLCCGALKAAEPAAAPPSQACAPDSLLPLKITGYDLKVLDVKKSVFLGVDGRWIEASLPIFFYFPNADRARATDLLRGVRDDLGRLGRQSEWTSDDLARIVSRLDDALRLLDFDGPTPTPKSGTAP